MDLILFKEFSKKMSLIYLFTKMDEKIATARSNTVPQISQKKYNKNLNIKLSQMLRNYKSTNCER